MQHLQHRMLGGDDHRIAHYAGLVALDFGHMGGLFLRRQVLVHDTNAALLSDGNRQARLGYGVHGGGYQRQIKPDIARKTGGERSVLGQDLRIRWHQQHVVEGERFA